MVHARRGLEEERSEVSCVFVYCVSWGVSCMLSNAVIPLCPEPARADTIDTSMGRCNAWILIAVVRVLYK